MQQFLTNLLPGLRDLRAPLAAGYLWLTVIWVLVADRLPERSEAEGLLAALYRLVDSLGPVSGAIAISFAAYLLGAISETVVDYVLNVAWRRSFTNAAASYAVQPSSESLRRAQELVERKVRAYIGNLRDKRADLCDFVSDHYAGVGFSAALDFGSVAHQQVAFMLEETDREEVLPAMVASIAQAERNSQPEPVFTAGRWSVAVDNSEQLMYVYRRAAISAGQLSASLKEEIRGAIAQVDHAPELTLRLARESQERLRQILSKHAPDFAELLPTPIERSVAYRLTRNMLDGFLEQLHLLEARLLTKNAELYGRFDRLKAESQLRVAIALPLFALVVVAGLKVSRLLFAAAIGVGLLAVSGWNRGREAGDTLVDAMLTADVEPPVLQDLREATERVELHAPVATGSDPVSG